MELVTAPSLCALHHHLQSPCHFTTKNMSSWCITIK